jgi:anti-sigma-K factor RskA
MNIQEYISSGIIEQYVMGLCSDEETHQVETLRKQYPELNNAITKYEDELEKRMLQNSTLPSVATDDKILHELDVLNQPTATTTQRAKVIQRNWLKSLAVAASLLLIVCTYFIYSLTNKTKQLEQQVAQLEKGIAPVTLPLSDYRVMLNEKITPVAMYGVGRYIICRCTMFWDKKTAKSYIIIHHLPESSSSESYQLWARVNNNWVSAGVVNDKIRGRFIEMENIPGASSAFIITLEKAGGSNAPDLEKTYVSGRI